MLLASDAERAENSPDEGCRTGDDPSAVVAVMMVVVEVVHRGGSMSAAESAGSAMGCREAGSSQRQSGHEGHDQFLVVRFITVHFLPLWALHGERHPRNGFLTGKREKSASRDAGDWC